MYKIRKKIHYDKKPEWIVGLLYKIPPSVYDWQETTEACMKRLTIIKDILEKSSVCWHRGYRNLTQIRDIKVNGKCLVISTKTGRSSLSFHIVEK